MIMKDRTKCRDCFYGWKWSNTFACEYQLVTGKRRINTARKCECYTTFTDMGLKSKKSINLDDKIKIYEKRKLKNEQ